MDGAPADDRGEAPASALSLRVRPLPEEAFPESLLEGRETDDGPPTDIEPDLSLPDRERERSEFVDVRVGRRVKGPFGREGGGAAGGTGKIGTLSPPGT